MKNYDKCKIEIMYESYCGDDEYRCFYWRINQKELNLWNRIFNNPWIKFEHANYDHLSSLYSIQKYHEDIKNITTYEQAVRYQEMEYEKVRRKNEELAKKRIKWGF